MGVTGTSSRMSNVIRGDVLFRGYRGLTINLSRETLCKSMGVKGMLCFLHNRRRCTTGVRRGLKSTPRPSLVRKAALRCLVCSCATCVADVRFKKLQTWKIQVEDETAHCALLSFQPKSLKMLFKQSNYFLKGLHFVQNRPVYSCALLRDERSRLLL